MNILGASALIALALLVWWLLLQKLQTKPWLEQGIPIDSDLNAAFDATLHSPKLIGLGVFLAVVTALFALFAAAYHMRMAVPDWTHLPLPKILWLNTALLTVSSGALQWAWFASTRIERSRYAATMRHGLIAALCLTLAFLAGQVLAWRQLDANGFYFSCTPASAFFYLLSGLHGAHLLGGLAVLTKTTYAVSTRTASTDVAYRYDIATSALVQTAAATSLSIKLCALYWHYLLGLWLALYALLALT
jgi:cytochrome c oxidase subunit 3